MKGIIFDIDGTLILNNQPLPNARETINDLRKLGVQLRFVTNTTGRTPKQLMTILRELGFQVDASEILTSVAACIYFLNENNYGKAGYLAIPDRIKEQFTKIKQTTKNPSFVVMGDLDKKFDYTVLNRIFNYMRNGAQLITFHRNPFFFKEGKTWLDSGAFTLALEHAGDQKAIVTGKPAAQMFQHAVQSMGLPKHEVIVIGDDVLSDILGAEQAGLQSYLVTTGKFKPEQLNEHDLEKERLLNNLYDVISMCTYEDKNKFKY
ncbi:HAD-IIA family hydrolase [Vibrio ezurae]|uniref:Putative hydrolase n=1 Tax=Vibrio ezurae NBRC 102218 TaxID=1219080 RepID=U3B2A9_9VIBR|nr:HAD-IIA family hydrolase [Vibrio ezurae]GAD80095.1 putative hydrolase [Vibrio ezurae NBRC 102218]